MTKKSLIEREKRNQQLNVRYFNKRLYLKKKLKEANNRETAVKIMNQLQKLPRNSAPTRLKNRCLISGRARGYYRESQSSRFYLRSLSLNGTLPGLEKASW